MKLLNGICVRQRFRRGEVLVGHLFGTEADLISTADMTYAYFDSGERSMMTVDVDKAKREVIRAGKQLVKKGLAARTLGKYKHENFRYPICHYAERPSL